MQAPSFTHNDDCNGCEPGHMHLGTPLYYEASASTSAGSACATHKSSDHSSSSKTHGSPEAPVHHQRTYESFIDMFSGTDVPPARTEASNCHPPPPPPPPAHHSNRGAAGFYQGGQQAAMEQPPPISHPAHFKAARMLSEDNDDLLNNSSLCGMLTPPPKTLSRGQAQRFQSTPPKSRANPAKAGSHRCVQCGAQASELSSFDHTCPKCGVVVCYNCVDDFRLIIPSYQCPHCGEQQANQAELIRTAWLRNMLRSAKSVYRSINESWNAMFLPESCDTRPLCGNAMDSEVNRSGNQRLPCGAYPLQAAPSREGPMKLSNSSAANTPNKSAESASPAEASMPEHRTRLPAGWEEGAGLHGQALLQRMGVKDPFRMQLPHQRHGVS